MMLALNMMLWLSVFFLSPSFSCIYAVLTLFGSGVGQF